MKCIIVNHIVASVLKQLLTGRYMLFQVLNGRKDHGSAAIGANLIIVW